MILLRSPRQKLVYLTLLVATSLVLTHFVLFSDTEWNPQTSFDDMLTHENRTQEAYRFWDEVFTVIEHFGPNTTDDENAITYRPGELIRTDSTKLELLAKTIVSEATIEELKTKHAAFANALPSENWDSTYKPGTRGVVVVGGDKYSWLAYMMIYFVRDLGSTVPVEVVFPGKKEYEADIKFCEKIETMNARCIVIDDVLGPAVSKRWGNKFRSYQLKLLALIVSSFQNVFLFDSDNIPVDDPETLLKSEVYKKHGLITWPDYWKRTISPFFYEIIGKRVDETKRVRYEGIPFQGKQKFDTDFDIDTIHYQELEGAIASPSTESGQLMINKATHKGTLLFSLYYNVYGPNYYYKLLSLGAPGEGDKETFAAAAHFTNESYYQSKSTIRTHGYFKDGFNGVAMGQKNPQVDYERYKKFQKKLVWENSIQDQMTQIDKFKKTLDDTKPVVAMHCNYPKFDPADLMSYSLYDKDSKRFTDEMFSGFTIKHVDPNSSGNTKKVDISFEWLAWRTIQSALCIEKIEFDYFKTKDMDQICTFARNQVDWLGHTDSE